MLFNLIMNAGGMGGGDFPHMMTAEEQEQELL